MVTIERKSLISGKITAMVIDATYEELNNWQDGELIQNALPRATLTQREFLISGLTAAEQERFFEEDE